MVTLMIAFMVADVRTRETPPLAPPAVHDTAVDRGP
jgi:hypothetical protein